MNIKESIQILESGKLWGYIDSNAPKDEITKISSAIDIAIVCMNSIEDLEKTLERMDRLDKEHDANVAHGAANGPDHKSDDPYTGDRAPVVTGEESCAECLCRVCARNVNNDSSNPAVDFEYKDCVACENCKIGETHIVDVDTDCPTLRYLPDVDDGNVPETDE